jgi:predicted phosphodiesterase
MSAASITVAIVSDVHFPHHHTTAWAAFREWHSVVKPYWTIALGDWIDFAALSRYDKSGDEALPSVEIALAVRELNALAKEATRVTFAVGNHEARFRRMLSAIPANVLEGLKGLTLRDQMHAHGLNDRVQWYAEGVGVKPLTVGQFVLRHGDQQAGRFGGGVNPASNRLSKSLGPAEIFGHHHAAQHVARAAHGRTVDIVANPCLSGMHSYAGSDMVWPLGFTILEVFPGWQRATAHLVVMDERGAFAWNGRVYGVEAANKRSKQIKNARTNARRK